MNWISNVAGHAAGRRRNGLPQAAAATVGGRIVEQFK